jgi:hypothetical protein
MRTSDWDDPEIRAIGRRYAAEAYDLASELHNFGADAAELLRPQPDPRRPRDVTIPVMLADVIMAVFLALPRPEWAPDQPLGENVTALATRRSWAAGAPGASSDSGPSGAGRGGPANSPRSRHHFRKLEAHARWAVAPRSSAAPSRR